MKWVRSVPTMTQGYRAVHGKVPGDDKLLHQELTKKISDFNHSCRDFASEPALVCEIMEQIVKEANGATPKYASEPNKVHEAMKDRYENPRDEEFVPAMPCLSIPVAKRRHRIKANGLRAGINVKRTDSVDPFTCSSTSGEPIDDVKPIWDRVADDHYLHACVARPVRKDEIARESGAQAAERKEWDNLRAKDVWARAVIREFNEVAQTARRENKKVHLGRMFGLMVETGSELPKDDPPVENTNIGLCFRAITLSIKIGRLLSSKT